MVLTFEIILSLIRRRGRAPHHQRAVVNFV